jgi:hypothetical protein
VGLAVVLALMSLDEATSIHEMTTNPLRSLFETSGALYFAWVIPAMAFVAVFGILYSRFLFHLPARHSIRFLFAGSVYLLGVLGMEMVGGAYVSDHGYSLIYGAIATVEEILEMSGIAILILALLHYMEEHVTSVSVQIKR